jgi:hypothetical protein
LGGGLSWISSFVMCVCWLEKYSSIVLRTGEDGRAVPSRSAKLALHWLVEAEIVELISLGWHISNCGLFLEESGSIYLHKPGSKSQKVDTYDPSRSVLECLTPPFHAAENGFTPVHQFGGFSHPSTINMLTGWSEWLVPSETNGRIPVRPQIGPQLFKRIRNQILRK